MPLTPEQREARRQGIGGSDVAAVLGRHPTKTALSVWLSKVYDADEVVGDRVEAGNRLEGAIREWAADLLGESVSVPTDTVRHPSAPVMLANVDGILAGGRVLECKNIDSLQWRATEDDRTDGVLRHHWWQVQHYMEVMDAPGAVVAYLVGGNDMQLREVPRNRQVGAALRVKLTDWWQTYVVPKVPPENGTPDERMTLLERLRARESAGVLKTSDESIVALVQEYDRWRQTVDAAKRGLEGAKADLCAVIGPAAGLDLGDVGKVTWKSNKHGKRTLRVTLRGAPETDE